MNRQSGTRRRWGVAGGFGFAAVGLLIQVEPALAAPGATATPSSGLTAGQSVTVTLQGFTSQTGYTNKSVQQCDKDAMAMIADPNSGDPSTMCTALATTAQVPDPDASGGASVQVAVTVGAVGSAGTCNAGEECLLWVNMLKVGGSPQREYATVTIAMAGSEGGGSSTSTTAAGATSTTAVGATSTTASGASSTTVAAGGVTSSTARGSASPDLAGTGFDLRPYTIGAAALALVAAIAVMLRRWRYQPR